MIELKKTYELPMIRKWGLGKTFPRKLLCAQKCCLGMGSIEIDAVIDTLEMKLCTGDKRLQGNVSKLISAKEELNFVDSWLTKRK